jgi:flagellar basal body-associated protein FliL
VATEGKEAEASSNHGSEGGGGGGGLSRLASFPILPILNLLALLGTMGFFYYSRFLHKRPAITEEGERTKLQEQFSKPKTPAVPALIPFETMTINIGVQNEERAAPPPTSSRPAKLHYISLGFAVEIRDTDQKDVIESYRPQIIDKVIQLLGKKHFHELTNVQGRYILHSQMIERINQTIHSPNHEDSSAPTQEDLVTNVFFTQFTVQ